MEGGVGGMEGGVLLKRHGTVLVLITVAVEGLSPHRGGTEEHDGAI